MSTKIKLVLMTTLAALLVLLAAMRLRTPTPDPDRWVILGWGFVLIFGAIAFVRGIFAIRRAK